MNFNKDERNVILIVDDAPINLEILFKLLEYYGLKVLVSEDGMNAIEIAENALPDLILLDVLMPGIDGFETCRLLKKNPATQDIPVIFLTAITDKIDQIKGLNLGAVDYITKPLENKEVLARVNIHLRLRNLTKKLTEQNKRLEIEIFERQRVEEELRCHSAALDEWNNRYQALIQASGQILYDWYLDTNDIKYGGNVEQILGYSMPEMLGGLKRWLELVHPDDRKLFNEEINRILSAKERFHLEFRVARKDGTYITVENNGYIFLDSTGKVARMAGFVIDITEQQAVLRERKNAEQKIREQAAWLDITTDAIIVQDLVNKIQFWNKGAEHLYGWMAEEALSKNANQFLYQKQSFGQLKNIQKTLVEHGSWQGELYQVTKQGQEIIVASRWTLVNDNEGQAKSVLIVNSDITEKKQLEAQFLRAQRMESLGTLASGIAHDLNNALTPMLMTVQLLEAQLPDEKSQQWLTIMETNVKRTADLVKQVLWFSRGSVGNFKTLQVRYLISEIENIIKQTFSRAIEIRIDISEQNLWNIFGDATQLHQVLMNLCINAHDAMPNGGILKISAKNFWVDSHYAKMNIDAKVGSYVMISVCDTGIGIKREIVDRIFEPFFTTKEVGKGTGLGLSTVLGIIKSHFGFVNVVTDVGKGTEFQVCLPVTQTMETDSKLAGDELPPGHGELILVVDDEDSIREVTQTWLEKNAYKVIVASDGIDAIALYTEYQQEISVVLIDMMMPNMDGPTTINVLKKINPEIKIIGVSGLASNHEMIKILGNSVKTLLSKPYTSSDLLRNLQMVINTK
ncbi:response regulator [Nostoc sp. ATCC 53789]|uniref:hybrid sensor histidine kinase/response regulator n=1 Tax=Nostoc sp. ATCC 53789 TaxID=76335 RepID=UPI000DEC875B|nr:response regulator [Nostoc sp. ATCC 53789]QHG16533.1 response regulator [Nostoc sp. ATCC 53789]RCJ24358.1 hybrid sensor histidine kinase/response regulator [Nostoc sp. ATCC 53789]